MMGGAVGLADARTHVLTAAGASLPEALNGGYQFAFVVGAAFALVAGLLVAALLRPGAQAGAGAGPVAMH
jgi:hypothetical protein